MTPVWSPLAVHNDIKPTWGPRGAGSAQSYGLMEHFIAFPKSQSFLVDDLFGRGNVDADSHDQQTRFYKSCSRFSNYFLACRFF